jgi:hypothetical protein
MSARAPAGDAGLGQRGLGQPLVLALGVDAGEDAALPHAGQQPQRRDAGAGAELDDGLGARGGGQEAQRGAGGGSTAPTPDLGRPLPRGEQRRLLGLPGRDPLRELPSTALRPWPARPCPLRSCPGR